MSCASIGDGAPVFLAENPLPVFQMHIFMRLTTKARHTSPLSPSSRERIIDELVSAYVAHWRGAVYTWQFGVYGRLKKNKGAI